MFSSRHENAGQNHGIKRDNRAKFFGTVAQLRYLGAAVTNQNYIHEDNKSVLRSRNAFHHLA
jgi:hypothetical protein